MSAGKFETASQKLMRELTSMSLRSDDIISGRIPKSTIDSALQEAMEAAAGPTYSSALTGGVSRALYEANQPAMSAVMKAATGSLDKRMEEALGLGRGSSTIDAILDNSAGKLARELSSSHYRSGGVAPSGNASPEPKRLAHKPSSIVIRSATDLGSLIRKARKAMRMTQSDFSAHAGVGRRFLSELEGGKPSLEFDKVMACAEAAGVEIFSRTRNSQ